MKVVFSAEAKAGLREIAFFIARDNKTRALSFVCELRAKAQQLSDMPGAFPLVPRYEHHGIRRRPFRDYLISTALRPTRFPSFISFTARAITKRCSSPSSESSLPLAPSQAVN